MLRDGAGIAATIGILLYVLGFIATNTSLYIMEGVYDAEPFQSASITTGILFASFYVAAFSPMWLCQRIIRRRRQRRESPTIGSYALAILAGLGVAIGILLLFAELWAQFDSETWQHLGSLVLV